MHRQWIKSWRRKLDSSIWKMPPLYMRVFEWIIHSVNHEENSIPTPSGQLKILPGQRITSLRQIAEGVSYFEYGVERVPNIKTIKSILDWLESNGKCTVESNAKGTLITVINWNTYNSQGAEKVTQKEQEKVTQSKHGLDTNKNDKNEKNKNKAELLEICKSWKAYVEMRKMIKKPMTDYAMNLRVKDLFKLMEKGEDPIAVLNQSVSSSYQDLYPVKNKQEPTPHQHKQEKTGVVSDDHKRALERLRAEGYE